MVHYGMPLYIAYAGKVSPSIQDYNKVELLSLLLTALYSFKRFCSLPALPTLYSVSHVVH